MLRQKIREAILKTLGVSEVTLKNGRKICLDGHHCPPRVEAWAAGMPVHEHYARYIWDVFGWENRTITCSVNVVHLRPVQVGVTSTIDRLGFISRGNAAGNVKMGLYDDNGDTPVGGALLVPATAHALAGNTWQKHEVVLASSIQLTEGLYWIAWNHDTAGDDFRAPDASVHLGGTLICRSFNLAYANAFPDPCPAVVTYDELPTMFMRVASTP